MPGGMVTQGRSTPPARPLEEIGVASRADLDHPEAAIDQTDAAVGRRGTGHARQWIGRLCVRELTG